MIINILLFAIVSAMMTSWIWISWIPEKIYSFFSNLFVYSRKESFPISDEEIKKAIDNNLQKGLYSGKKRYNRTYKVSE